MADLTRPNAKQINFDVTNITDPLITLNNVISPPVTNTSDVGFLIIRGTGQDNIAMVYDESANKFIFANTLHPGTTNGNIVIASYADIKVQSILADSITATTSITAPITVIGDLDANNNKVINVAPPTLANDATNKSYVDNIVATASHIPNSEKGAPNGVATLDVNSKIVSSQLPALAITNTAVVANQASMLALAYQTGDVAVRTDVSETYILKGTDPATLSHWEKLLTPLDAVQSVNGQTGAITLSTTNISEGTNQYYTSLRVTNHSDVSANTTARHSHINAAILNATTASFTTALELDISNNKGAMHTHTNAIVLDATTASYTTAEKNKLAAMESGATADQTKIDIDALNINADLLDAQHGVFYLDYTNFVNVPATFTPNTENVQDIVGGMISANSELGLAVTYNDVTGKINFDVNDPSISLSGDVTGSATMTNLGNVNITTIVSNDSHTHDTRYFTETESDGRFFRLNVSNIHNGDITPSLDSTVSLGSLTKRYSTVDAVTFRGKATTAQYADVAEKYTADKDYEPGTVLIFGGTAEVTESTKYNDTRLVGVVTTDPALLMNNECQSEYIASVALLGRVPVKVIGTVSRGDIIIPSDIPGYASAHNPDSSHHPSAIIGKSIVDKNDTGKGIIEVLVGRI